MIYDRPVSELMADAAAALTPPFAVSDIVAWFEEHYPLIKHNTITAHIRGLTANDPNKHHHAWLAAKTPLFYRTAPGVFRRYEPDVDIADEEGGAEAIAADGAGELLSEQSAEFVLENQLESFLDGNWNVINWGRPLKVWQSPGGKTGHQFTTPVGRLDFLCI